MAKPKYKADAKATPEYLRAAFDWAHALEKSLDATFADQIASDIEHGWNGVPRPDWTAWHVATFTHGVLSHVFTLPAYHAKVGCAIACDISRLIPSSVLSPIPDTPGPPEPEESAE